MSAAGPAAQAVALLPGRLTAVGLGPDRAEVDAWSQDAWDDMPWIGSGEDVVWLDQLTSWERSRGLGRAAMAELCMLADEHGCRVALNPHAQTCYPGSLDQEALEGFYSSLGFAWRRDHVMVREPWADAHVLTMPELSYLPTPNSSRIILSLSLPPAALCPTAFVVPVTEDGRILVADSLKPGRGLEIPGGHLEPGEDPETAARREALEETGARLGPLVPIGHQRMTTEGERPEGWRYPFPLSHQPFFAARILSIDPHEPNDECAPPRLIDDPSALRTHERLLARRAVVALAAG